MFVVKIVRHPTPVSSHVCDGHPTPVSSHVCDGHPTPVSSHVCDGHPTPVSSHVYDGYHYTFLNDTKKLTNLAIKHQDYS